MIEVLESHDIVRCRKFTGQKNIGKISRAYTSEYARACSDGIYSVSFSELHFLFLYPKNKIVTKCRQRDVDTREIVF